MPHRASQRDVGGDAFQWQNYGFELLLGVLCVGLMVINSGLMVVHHG